MKGKNDSVEFSRMHIETKLKIGKLDHVPPHWIYNNGFIAWDKITLTVRWLKVKVDLSRIWTKKTKVHKYMLQDI